MGRDIESMCRYWLCNKRTEGMCRYWLRVNMSKGYRGYMVNG